VAVSVAVPPKVSVAVTVSETLRGPGWLNLRVAVGPEAGLPSRFQSCEVIVESTPAVDVDVKVTTSSLSGVAGVNWNEAVTKAASARAAKASTRRSTPKSARPGRPTVMSLATAKRVLASVPWCVQGAGRKNTDGIRGKRTVRPDPFANCFFFSP
jgi:hypothetical protein